MTHKKEVEALMLPLAATLQGGKALPSAIAIEIHTFLAGLEAIVKGLVDHAEFEGLVNDCEELNQQYIVPIDLSNIAGRFAEYTFIDPAIKKSPRALLTLIQERQRA